jgi:hypothetical protein
LKYKVAEACSKNNGKLELHPLQRIWGDVSFAYYEGRY